MKKKFTILLVALICNIKIVYCQTEKSVSVASEEYTSIPKLHTLTPPHFYKPFNPLAANEIQQLDTLTTDERKLIKNAVDPVAVGMVRVLKMPIIFDLKSIAIPERGEVSINGGRLTRVNNDTLAFTTCIRSEKADEIRVYFKEGFLPHGVQVNLFGKDDYAFTQKGLNGEIEKEGFYTTTTFSDYVIVQVIIPLKKIVHDVRFTISKITHVENRGNANYTNKPMADCYRDANCITTSTFPFINQLQNAVAAIYIPQANGSLVYQCTGSLVNDSRNQDFQPFFLTANHCFSTQASVTNIEVRFNYWSTSCNSGQSNPVQNQIIVNGANLIRTSTQNDFTLLLLKEKPGGSRTYLGWTTASVPDNQILRSVHHPEGTFQKYSRHQNNTSPSYTCVYNGMPVNTNHYLFTETLNGQTFGGSSGGAIINDNGQIVGQLLGVCPGSVTDLCNYNSYYNNWGKFSSSYNNNNLQYWLYNGGATVTMSTNPASALNFGAIAAGATASKDVIVSNTGTRLNNLNLEAGNATITGSNASKFLISGSNFLYLPPNSSDNFTIKFTPAYPGPYTATLNIPNNADNITGSKTITLTGCGVPVQPDKIIGIVKPSNGLQYTYSIAALPGATSYSWSYTGGGTISPNGTTCELIATTSGILSVKANVSCGSGLSQSLSLNVVDGISIYPNPAISQLTIEYGGNQALMRYEVFNVTGQLISSGNFTGRKILQIGHLARGVYYIKFFKDNNFELRKFEKM